VGRFAWAGTRCGWSATRRTTSGLPAATAGWRSLLRLSSPPPPEHYTQDGITRAFQVYGPVCSIDKECLKVVDES